MKLAEVINNKDISEGSKKTYLSILKRVEADKFKIPVGKMQMMKTSHLLLAANYH